MRAQQRVQLHGKPVQAARGSERLGAAKSNQSSLDHDQER